MKEKIINFLKSKKPISFFNIKLSPEAKFIILGLFYILIAMNIMVLFRIFDLFTFFCIYFCIKHLNSISTLPKNRNFRSWVIIVIFALELLTLIGFVTFIIIICHNSLYSSSKPTPNRDFRLIDTFTIFLSFILFLIYWIANYLKSNPNKIIDMIKTFIFEFFQFFAVAIFYFLVIKLTPEKYNSIFLKLAISINIILLAFTNILTKRVSVILETLSMGFLFIKLSLIFAISERLNNPKYLSLENYIVNLILIINLIGFTVIFFKSKIRAEKSKIILLIALMISFFYTSNNIIHLFYYLASLTFISLMIFCKTLKVSKVFIFFIVLDIILFMFSIPLSVGRDGGAGYNLMITFTLNLILIPIIVFFSNLALNKSESKIKALI